MKETKRPKDAFEQQAMNFLRSELPTSLHLNANGLRRALFCFVMSPRAATFTL